MYLLLLKDKILECRPFSDLQTFLILFPLLLLLFNLLGFFFSFLFFLPRWITSFHFFDLNSSWIYLIPFTYFSVPFPSFAKTLRVWVLFPSFSFDTESTQSGYIFNLIYVVRLLQVILKCEALMDIHRDIFLRTHKHIYTQKYTRTEKYIHAHTKHTSMYTHKHTQINLHTNTEVRGTHTHTNE